MNNSKVYSSGQYSIASQHYDPELSTVSVTVPDLSYHLQVVRILQPLLQDFCFLYSLNLFFAGVRGSCYTYHPGYRISTDIFRLPVGCSGKNLDPSSYLLPRVRFKTSKRVQYKYVILVKILESVQNKLPTLNCLFSRGLWADTDIVCEGGQVQINLKEK